MESPIYTHNDKVFLLYAGVQAEAKNRNAEMAGVMGDRFISTIPIDEEIIPKGINSVADALRSTGVPEELAFYTFYHESNSATVVFASSDKRRGLLPIEEQQLLLRTLAGYYGEPTVRDARRLEYAIKIGQRHFSNVYSNGRTRQGVEDITRKLIIDINSDPFWEDVVRDNFQREEEARRLI